MMIMNRLEQIVNEMAVAVYLYNDLPVEAFINESHRLNLAWETERRQYWLDLWGPTGRPPKIEELAQKGLAPITPMLRPDELRSGGVKVRLAEDAAGRAVFDEPQEANPDQAPGR